MSDLNIARADPVPTEANEIPVGSPLFDNISEFDENDLSSALFGGDWRDFCDTVSLDNVSLDNVSFDNEIVENPLPAPLIGDDVVSAGKVIIRDEKDVTSSTEIKSDPF
jgi:hypothetical protein